MSSNQLVGLYMFLFHRLPMFVIEAWKTRLHQSVYIVSGSRSYVDEVFEAVKIVYKRWNQQTG